MSTIGIEQKDVNEDTNSDYVIEASYINPELLSKKVFETKRKTADVYYKSSRGSEPHIEKGIESFCSLISRFGATVCNGKKIYTDHEEQITLDVSVNKINSIIGQKN